MKFLPRIYPITDARLAKISHAAQVEKLVEGHALACSDVLGVSSDQIVVGWRGTNPEKKAGIAVWDALDERGEKWRETVIDDGGMACEDLQVADLNGDGKLDIIASGRATWNVKIYFNETVRLP
jgi:hypothetical protein